MKPKPFASLNHFTVPVAIVGNSLSTRIKRDVARPMFRSQGKYGGRTTLHGRTERALLLGTKHSPVLYTGRGKKANRLRKLQAPNPYRPLCPNGRSSPSATKLAPDNGGALCQCTALRPRHIPRERHHPAVRA